MWKRSRRRRTLMQWTEWSIIMGYRRKVDLDSGRMHIGRYKRVYHCVACALHGVCCITSGTTLCQVTCGTCKWMIQPSEVE